MKAKSIKGITIEIGGDTTGLEKSLREVDKTTKDLQSELRGVNSLLKMDPKNVELLRQKETLLNKSIEETNKKLETLKEAQRQMKANGIDENSAAYRDLQREIVVTEQKLESLEDEQKEFARQNSDIVKTGEAWKDAGGKISAAGESMQAVSAAAAAALAGMAALAYKAGQTSDELNTLSKQTGLSTDQLQKFQYASDLIDVELSDVAKGLAKVTKAAASNSDVFEKLGVSTRDSSGQLRSAEDIFYDTIDALGKIQNETERNALANEIFGKSYMNLNPLIEGGADRLRELSATFDELDLGVDQETLDRANELNDQIDTLKATFQQAALVIGASLADTFGPQLDGAVEAVAKLANAFADLPKGVQVAIASFLGLIAVASPLLMAIGRIGSGIGAIITYGPAIMSAVSGIGTAFTALAGPIGIAIAAIAAAIAIGVLLYKNWDKIKEVAGVAWEGIKNTISAAVQTIKDICVSVWNGIKDAAVFVFEAIKAYFISIFTAYQTIFTAGWNIIKTVTTTVFNAIKAVISGMINGWKNLFTSGFNAIRNIASSRWNAIKNAIVTPIEKAKGLIKNLVDKIKGIMQFKFKLPKIKLPHFSISPKGWNLGDLLEGIIPSLGINWYAKGGIFDSPSIIGLGEAGSEAVVPLEPFWKRMDQMAESIKSAQGESTVINVYAQPGMDVNQIAAAVENRLVRQQKRKERVFA